MIRSYIASWIVQTQYGLSFSESDLVVQDLFLTWWTTFAKTGKPTADDSWRPFKPMWVEKEWEKESERVRVREREREWAERKREREGEWEIKNGEPTWSRLESQEMINYTTPLKFCVSWWKMREKLTKEREREKDRRESFKKRYTGSCKKRACITKLKSWKKIM